MSGLINPYEMPGMGTPAETTEREFLWGRLDSWQLESIVISSAAVDSGNTPTTTLRRSLLLGKVTSSGEYKEYNPTGTDGSQIVQGILYEGLSTLNAAGSATDKMGRMVIAGNVKAAQLLLLDAQARRQMSGRFLFDDDLPGKLNGSMEFVQEVAKTADYTVVAADSGTLFTNTGAVATVNFTLPTLANGLIFGFFVVADQTLTVTSAAGDDMVVPNDASADSVSFGSAGDKIGGMVVVRSNAAGTKWHVEKRSSNALTIVT